MQNAPVKTLDTLFTIAPERKQSEAVRPAKAWRNRWFTSRRATMVGTNIFVGPGEYNGLAVHPSKEVAEARALAQLTNKYIARGVKYLGAFPIDTTP